MSHGIYDSNHIMNALAGQMGADFISDTQVHSPTAPQFYVALIIIADTKFTTLTDDPAIGGNAISSANDTFTATTVLFGHFTTVTLASGKVYALKGL